MRLVSTSFLFGEDCANTWINIFLEHLRTPLRLYAGPAAQTRQTVFLVADSFTMGSKCLLSTRNIATFPEKETDKEKKCGHKNHLQKSILETTRVSFSKTISQLSSLLFGSSLLFRGGVHFCSPHHFCVGARANFNSDSAQGSVQCFTPWGSVIHRRLAGMS